MHCKYLESPGYKVKGERKRGSFQAADAYMKTIPHSIQTLKPACSGTNIRALGWVRGSAYRESLKKSKILRENNSVFFAESAVNLEIHPLSPTCNAVT